MSEQLPKDEWTGPREGQAYVLWLENHNVDLRRSLRREENARKVLAETERRQAAEIARLQEIIDRCAS